MAIDPREFRNTVGRFATGVTVITAELDGQPKGMTANAFTSVSLDPPLVLFCVGKHAHLGEAVRQVTHFSVNILSDAQQDLSTFFSGGWKSDTPPPFSLIPWEGVHRIEGAAAALACATEEVHEGGDHWIVIGRVIGLHRVDDAQPLLFYQGRYGRLGA